MPQNSQITPQSRRFRGINHLTEQVAQRPQLAGNDAEEGPAAALFAFDQTGLEQHLEVVGDGRLAEAERLGEVADAGFVVGLRLNQAEEAQTRRVGQHFQSTGERVGFGRGERAAKQRGTRRRNGRYRLHQIDIDTDR